MLGNTGKDSAKFLTAGAPGMLEDPTQEFRESDYRGWSNFLELCLAVRGRAGRGGGAGNNSNRLSCTFRTWRQFGAPSAFALLGRSLMVAGFAVPAGRQPTTWSRRTTSVKPSS